MEGWRFLHPSRTAIPVQCSAFRDRVCLVGALRRPLGLANDLVGEEYDIAPDGLGVDTAYRSLVAGRAEEPRVGPSTAG
jgi:hypothetical protein